MAAKKTKSTQSKAAAPQMFHRTDAGNSELFAALNKDDLRYDFVTDRWMVREGHRWVEEDKGQTVRRAIKAARHRVRVSRNCKEPEAEVAWGFASESGPRINAMLQIARSIPPLSSAGTQWDADPWVLGTPDGIYDLRAGRKITMDAAELYITKQTSVSPAPTADCPLWAELIDTITLKDKNYSRYLQRSLGYAITGNTSEQSMWFFVGSGANAKGTVQNTLFEILGGGRDGYALVLPIRVLTASRYEQHPTELADLPGKRLVISSETEPGRHWRECLLKGMVAGDPMSARKMRSDAFTFQPTHKIIVSGNDMPHLSDVKEAERRRYMIVPFTVRFKFPTDPDFNPDKDVVRDKDFQSKLRREYPAILRWLMDGTLMWIKEGLNPPAAVVSATSEYMTAEDRESMWIKERCTADVTAKFATQDLYDNWVEWCRSGGESPGTRREFTERLKRRGYDTCTVGHGKQAGLRGLKLRGAGDAPAGQGQEPDANTRVN